MILRQHTRGFFETTGALFSDCKQYRYHLWRRWDTSLPVCNFLMLNPSTADDWRNDPTVERCEQRARFWKYGGLSVTNIFAFRATQPEDMLYAEDPIGPDNNRIILAEAQTCGIVICAWGNHGDHFQRNQYILFSLLYELRHKLHALGMTKAGNPQHPLYLPYDLQPQTLKLKRDGAVAYSWM